MVVRARSAVAMMRASGDSRCRGGGYVGWLRCWQERGSGGADVDGDGQIAMWPNCTMWPNSTM